MNQPDDHMDELFRKAGELYPLKTDGQNWDKVLAGLQQEPEGGALFPPGKRGNNGTRKLWWLTLLLLLPLSWLTWKFAGTSFHQKQSAPVASTQPSGKAASGATAGAASGATAGPASGTTAGSTSGATAGSASGTTPGSTADAVGTRHGSTPGTASNTASGTSPNSTHGGVASLAASNSNSANNPSHNGGSGSVGGSKTRSQGAAAPGFVVGGAAVAGADNANGSNPGAANDMSANQSSGLQPSSPFEWTAGDVANANAQKNAADLAIVAPNANEHPKGPTALKVNLPKHNGPKPGFYAGVIGGPDVSLVKLQQVEHPGYSLGFLLGYRFNRSLSVEASALWDRKNYYTTGEYFNKTKAGFSGADTINYMSGNCNMFEIPVSLRWDFLQFKKGGLYATAGISSYIMKQENYSYNASGYGTSWDGQKSYQNSGNDFLSIMHLSVGYTVPWGRVGDLRIEPYWKIPLTGVGIGNLPITSMGLYLGLTHSFH